MVWDRNRHRCLLWYSCHMTASEQALLETRLEKIYQPERMIALGANQRKLLHKFVGQEVTKYQGKAPPEENLEAILSDVEEYYPEELTPFCGLLPQEV